MSYTNITTDVLLRQYAERLARAKSIALDTEFVSEHTYRPVLCLVQVVADGQPALIDALTIDDMGPFWQAVAEPGHETIVHAGRSEVEFCLQAVRRRPAGLFDVQIAAGLIGVEYPAAYSTLASKLLDRPPQKHETRTDWRRRPLSERQIRYSLDDVVHLPALRHKIRNQLEKLRRLAWLEEEMDAWQEEIERAFAQERWWRVSGSSGLSSRSLEIVRHLWQWREAEAERRDRPARRVLRDDLIVELARRQTADVKRIKAVRGLERGDLNRRLPELAKCIRRALAVPDQELPKKIPRDETPHLSVLGQLLSAALGSICREARLAPGLVGNPSDVRQWIAYHNGRNSRQDRKPPLLARGWRAEVIGQLLSELMSGQKSIRINDSASKHPLVFDSVNQEKRQR